MTAAGTLGGAVPSHRVGSAIGMPRASVGAPGRPKVTSLLVAVVVVLAAMMLLLPLPFRASTPWPAEPPGPMPAPAPGRILAIVFGR